MLTELPELWLYNFADQSLTALVLVLSSALFVSAALARLQKDKMWTLSLLWAESGRKYLQHVHQSPGNSDKIVTINGQGHTFTGHKHGNGRLIGMHKWDECTYIDTLTRYANVNSWEVRTWQTVRVWEMRRPVVHKCLLVYPLLISAPNTPSILQIVSVVLSQLFETMPFKAAT